MSKSTSTERTVSTEIGILVLGILLGALLTFAGQLFLAHQERQFNADNRLWRERIDALEAIELASYEVMVAGYRDEHE